MTTPQAPQFQGLQPGQTYAAVVRVQNGTLVAQIAGARLPLPEDAALHAGQRINVQILSAGQTVQYEVTPAPSASGQAPTTTPAVPLDALLRPLLQALGKLDLAPRTGSLLPPRLPQTSASLQPLLTTLLSARGLGQDLQQLQQVLTTATAQSGVAPQSAQAISQWLNLVSGSVGEAWRGLLERARAERFAAARIAQSLGPRGNPAGLAGVRDSAATLVQQLLNDEGFLHTLRDQGTLASFRALAGRIQDHARGSDLQNLRSLDLPYEFLELPVSEASGFRRAHVHSFSDARSGARPRRAAVYQTILDLDTTRLGPLWISLRASGDQCACRFRTISADIATLFESEAPGLQEALAGAGFPNATITTEVWDGRREEALIELFAPYQKLDLEG